MGHINREKQGLGSQYQLLLFKQLKQTEVLTENSGVIRVNFAGLLMRATVNITIGKITCTCSSYRPIHRWRARPQSYSGVGMKSILWGQGVVDARRAETEWVIERGR